MSHLILGFSKGRDTFDRSRDFSAGTSVRGTHPGEPLRLEVRVHIQFSMSDPAPGQRERTRAARQNERGRLGDSVLLTLGTVLVLKRSAVLFSRIRAEMRADWGSVLIRIARHEIASCNVLRIHPESDCLLDFAAAEMAFKSSALKRTGTMRPLASPFGNLGLPTFLDFAKSVFPHNRSSNSGNGRFYGRKMQNGYISSRFLRIIGIVRPCVSP
jgi:hypothetical protein